MNPVLSAKIFMFFLNILFICLERGKGREKERERNISVWLPFTCPQLGTWPATQACSLTGTRTGYSLVRRLALTPLSHTSQGHVFNVSNLLYKASCSHLDQYFFSLH